MKPVPLRIGAALLFLGTAALRADDAALKSQFPVADAAVAQSAPNAYRVLFVGDSITRHGTNDDIRQRLGWDHVAGMAATSEDKDYVHLLAARLQAAMPDRKVEIYYDSQAKALRPQDPPNLPGGSAAQKAALLRSTASFHPHLVVIQLGEHEDPAQGEDGFRQAYDRLVISFAGEAPAPRVVCAGVWQPGDLGKGQDSYAAGWGGTVERVMRDVCQAHGIEFASVRPFATDPSCRGSGESPGVRWHPNDKGMEGYAQALFDAFQRGNAAAGGKDDGKAPDGSALSFDFRAAALPAGWAKTTAVNAVPSASGLHLEATGWDAKIYRSGISLPAGRYVLYGRGHGNLKVVIQDGWKGPVLTHLVLSGDKPFTDYVDFTVGPAGARSLLLMGLVDAPQTQADLEWLKIESAPPVEADTGMAAPPSPEELEKARPDPPVVRGFMIRPVGQVQRQDFFDAAAWGANVVRLQVRPAWLAQQIGKPLWEAWPAILDQVDQAVADAGDAGLKVVVVLMYPPVPGVQFDGAALWHSPDLESDFTRVWADLATRLKPRAKTIWGYDIYNEPLDRTQLPWTPKQWYPLALKILKAIRAVDPDVWIVYESGPGGMDRGFEGLVPLPDTHVIYSFHDYSPGKFAMQGVSYTGDLYQSQYDPAVGVSYPLTINGTLWDKAQLRSEMESVVEFQKKWRVPIYVGEFSVVRWAPKDDAVRWLQDMIDIFESLGWSWSYHAFREWNGWSLEYDETFWTKGMPPPQRVDTVTERGKVLRHAFEKNRKAAPAAVSTPP